MKKPGITGFMWDNRSRAGRCTTTSRPLTHESTEPIGGLAMNATRKCTAPDCTNKHLAKGWCKMHYQRMRNNGSLDLKHWTERFWEKVDKSGDCWQWTSAVQNSGYGLFGHERNGKHAMVGAHRISWTIANGPIPEGLLIDHICLNKLCVNPAHLRLATDKQNAEHYGKVKGNNKSGVRGVWWDKRKGKWIAIVVHHAKRHHVGFFDDLDKAEVAVIAKRNELFTHNDIDRIAA